MTHDQILRLIGTNIRKARHAAHLSQEGLAEMADIHWKTLGYIESGQRDFGVTIFTRLALCLDISGNQLLDGLETKRSKRLQVLAKTTARKRRYRENGPQ
jgi:transcriptional regulator with XRE-family HTH domain